MIERFTKENYHVLCDIVTKKDKDVKSIIKQYGYPPWWVRPNTFETLVLTILEQQVSLASAYAAYQKLKEKINSITPKNLLALTDEELRSCYFSRQKIVYTRELASAIISKHVSLENFFEQPDEIVRTKLKKIKGVGDWTVDIYLIHALRRTNVFPVGDVALVNAIKMLKQHSTISKEGLLHLAKNGNRTDLSPL
ncbi:MAG: DNA-3-methyladenine glycosylase [Chitinophagaceae bacterium]